MPDAGVQRGPGGPPHKNYAASGGFARAFGLKSESRKVTAPVLVIDSADETPTPN